jgi:hypothetical protein
MSSDITHTRTKHMQTLCTTANTILRPMFRNKDLSYPEKNIRLQQIWYRLQCPSVQPLLLISHNLLYKSDTFLTSPATEQLRMTDSITKVSSCCIVWEKTNLIMTHGFFTTNSFMLPGLVCRSLEICAYCTCKETHQLIIFTVTPCMLLQSLLYCSQLIHFTTL